MQVRVNGKLHSVDAAPTSLQGLLETMGYEPKSIAVAVDGHFVPRHQYTSYILKDAQDLEVVSPMQGG
jgi:sulfur carrier protein